MALAVRLIRPLVLGGLLVLLACSCAQQEHDDNAGIFSSDRQSTIVPIEYGNYERLLDSATHDGWIDFLHELQTGQCDCQAGEWAKEHLARAGVWPDLKLICRRYDPKHGSYDVFVFVQNSDWGSLSPPAFICIIVAGALVTNDGVPRCRVYSIAFERWRVDDYGWNIRVATENTDTGLRVRFDIEPFGEVRTKDGELVPEARFVHVYDEASGIVERTDVHVSDGEGPIVVADVGDTTYEHAVFGDGDE